jgi:Protein of unknown function with HXXEE motif
MPTEFSSIIIGTSGLTIAVAASSLLAISRPRVSAFALPRVRRLAIAGLLLQTCHFAEEYWSHFYVRFPEFLGLTPWSSTFFVAFNLVWIAIWSLSIAFIGRYPRLGIFPIWFLAIASAVNGVVHPILSLAVSGYFPGLWTSPLVGILGGILLRTLASSTKNAGATRGAT